MTNEHALLRDGRTVEFLPDMIGDGTMKEVYFTADRKSVICFYKDASSSSDPVRMQRLESILGKYNPTIPENKGGSAKNEAEANYYLKLYCWPTGIVVKPRFGIITPTYPDNFYFGSGPDFIKGKEKNGMRFIGRKNRTILEKVAPDELGNWLNYFSLCIQMARAVARLHNAGLAHSDLSPNNVLVDPSKGMSIIIDIDSLVVEGLFPPDVLGTKGYIAPEVLSTVHLPVNDPKRKAPNASTDQHALAVLIYQYLLLRHPLDGRRIPPARTAEEQEMMAYGSQAIFCEHPNDPSNRPEESKYAPCSSLGPFLQDLFTRAFVKGISSPNDRPAASDWLRGLAKTWDLLMPCPNSSCSHKWFVVNGANSIKCSFCGTGLKTAIPFLKLRKEGRPGQWSQDCQLVVYHNLSIFKWHVFDGIFPGPESDRTPQAYCVFHQGKWLLINQNLASLTSPGGNRVAIGKAVELKDGAQIRLSQEPHGRIAEVHMIAP
ncbi:MAG: serine/threonine protein kinase [Pseudomonadota bacterium]